MTKAAAQPRDRHLDGAAQRRLVLAEPDPGAGSIEADFLNGEIVLLGREHGVPAPVNKLLQRLANQAAREHRAPGGTAPGEVMALLAA
jgi:hypothetical protein